MSSVTSPKRVSTSATTWGFLNSTGRRIIGSASFPISRLSSVFMASGASSPCLSQRPFSLSAMAGSTLVPTRKLSDSTALTASATFSAKRGIRPKTPSHRGQSSPSTDSSPRASRIMRPRTSLVIPVPTFPNMRPRQRSQSPSDDRARAASTLSAIHSSMSAPHRSNPISAILRRGRWLSR